MASILVTGAGGFIGSELVRKLVEQGDDVVCLAHHRRYEERLRTWNVRVVTGDVRSTDSLRQALQGIDTVYHLAGRIRALSVESFRDANTRGMENMARACAAQKTPPVLVMVSSLAAGGPSRPGQPRTEANRPAPISHYGQSKWDGELAAAKMAGEVPISVVRPPFVFGGGDQTSLAIFATIKRWKLHPIPRGNDPELTLIHVADLVHALRAVAKHGERLDRDEIDVGGDHFQRGLYYVGDPQVVTYTEFGRFIGQALNCPVRIIRVAGPLLWTFAMCNEWTGKLIRRAAVMNLDKYREAMAAAWTCSSAKIRTQLGTAPAASLAKRVEETTNWYLGAGWV